MIRYAMNPSEGTHGLRRREASRGFARVRAFLEWGTTCVGPSSFAIDGAPVHGGPWDLGAVARVLVEAEAAGRFGAFLTLPFDLRDADGRPRGGHSRMLLFLDHPNTSSCSVDLDFRSPTFDAFVSRIYDGVLATMGVRLSPKKFIDVLAKPERGHTYRRVVFDRAAHPHAPQGPTEEMLVAAALREPADEGRRLVLADWLVERGDARGELLIALAELAHVGDDDARRDKLARRVLALRRRHAQAWEHDRVVGLVGG